MKRFAIAVGGAALLALLLGAGIPNGAVQSWNGDAGYWAPTAQPTPAPVGAGYWTKTSDTTLTNEQSMGSLGTGLVKNTTTTGVPTIYAGTSCTNQFPRSLSSSGAATCASVDLSADTASTALPATKGGTGLTTTTQGGLLYGGATNTAAWSDACTSGQMFVSAGTGTPYCGGNAPIFTTLTDGNYTTTSASAGTITGLSRSHANGYIRRFSCQIVASGTASGGPRLTVTASGVTTIAYQITYDSAANPTTTALYLGANTSGQLTASCTSGSCDTGKHIFRVVGMALGSGIGTVAIAAANSTSGQTTTIYKGSGCDWTNY